MTEIYHNDPKDAFDHEYFKAINKILDDGTCQLNERTGEKCWTYPGLMMEFDLQKGFPAPTTKPLAWESVKGEWIGFIQGATSAADFRALGSKVWDANANETPAWLTNPFRKGEDDLGPIYGAQWRKWPAHTFVTWDQLTGENRQLMNEHLDKHGWNNSIDTAEGNFLFKEIDQVADCIRKLILTPSDRRILFHGWNPAVLDQIALPSCHLLYQFLPNLAKRELSMTLYIR